MTKVEARKIIRAFKLIADARHILTELTDKAVERDEFYSPDGLYEDLNGMDGELKHDIEVGYGHRLYDARVMLGLDGDTGMGRAA